MSEFRVPSGWTAFTTYKGHTVYVTTRGMFCADVNQEIIDADSLESLEGKIDRASKVKYQKVPAMRLHTVTGVSPLDITGVDRGGRLRSGRNTIYSYDEVWHLDREATEAFQALVCEANEATNKVEKEMSRLKSVLRRVNVRDMVPESGGSK